MAKPTDKATALRAALALAQAGKTKDARQAFDAALRVWPKDPDVLILAGAARAQGDDPAAGLRLIRKALDAQPLRGDGWFQLGVALRASGDMAAAREAFQKAIDYGFDQPAVYGYLGDVLITLDEAQAALDAFDIAANAQPTPAALSNRAQALAALNRFDEAVEAAQAAISGAPNLAPAYVNLGVARAGQGDYEGAYAAYQDALKLAPKSLRARHGAALAKAARHVGDADTQTEIERLFAHDRHDQVALALQAAALAERGAIAESEALQGFERFVRAIHPAPPKPYGSIEDFNAALTAHATGHASLKIAPPSHATRAGEHSGDLTTNDETGVMAAMRRMLTGVVTDIIAALDRDDDHPFIQNAPKKWTLDIWSVVMRRGGHQRAHIHANGWMSGVFYPEVPSDVPAAAPETGEPSGWLEVGRPGDHIGITAAPPIRLFQPKPGRLIVFPSYVHHRTIPLDSDQRRVSVAFDVVPQA